MFSELEIGHQYERRFLAEHWDYKRIGQGRFRHKVIQLWGKCAVTGVRELSVLQASHIKPWRTSSDDERLNPYNGLLLTPDFDALFDKGFITFKDKGQIIVSDQLQKKDRLRLHVDDSLSLRRTFSDNRSFLEYHRDVVFQK